MSVPPSLVAVKTQVYGWPVPSKKALTKDDWLNAAMELLRTDGVGGVRVLTLAQKLRVSRGSFYWHFED